MTKTRLLLILVIVTILSFSCSKRYSGSYFTVTSVNNQCDLVLKNGDVIRLIGVFPGDKVRRFLEEEILEKEVRLFSDNGLKKGRKKKGDVYWAYVLTKDGLSLNAEILRRGYSSLNTANLRDSLNNFRAYAGNTVQPPDRSSNSPKDNHSGERFTPAEIYKMYENSIVVVYSGTGSGMQKLGTGFFISNTTVITNHHVIEGGSQIVVKMKNGEIYPVRNITAKNKKFDYAILDVEISSKITAIPVSVDDPQIGEDIIIIGNPQGLEFTLTKGVISALRDQENEKNAIIQFDAAISQGNSGSPVINLRGEVIGVATFMVLDCQNCNFAYASRLFMSALN